MLGRPAHRIAEIGIARTFQNLALFGPQSVLDNVRLGTHAHSRSDFVSDALRLPWVRRQETAVSETAWSLLENEAVIAAYLGAGYKTVDAAFGGKPAP